MNKYINADKLKEEMIGRWSFREESSIFKLIDELSEEREEPEQETLTYTEQISQEFSVPGSMVTKIDNQSSNEETIKTLQREKEVLLERLKYINSSIAISNAFGVSVEEVLKTTLDENVQLKKDNKTLNEELEEVMSDRDDLAKRFIEFKNRENVILEASVKEMENRKRVLINKILDFNNQYKNSISTIQDFKNGVHRACTQIIDLVGKM